MNNLYYEIENFTLDDLKQYVDNGLISVDKADDEMLSTSLNITKYLFERLKDKLPLTPITENDAFIEEFRFDTITIYKCKRCESFVKIESLVDNEKIVRYYDENRIYFINTILNNGYKYKFSTSHLYFLTEFINNLLPPITLPYFPRKGDTVLYIEEFYYNRRENSDSDSLGLYGENYITKLLYIEHCGIKYPINKCYKIKAPMLAAYTSAERYVEISDETYEKYKNSRSDAIANSIAKAYGII